MAGGVPRYTIRMVRNPLYSVVALKGRIMPTSKNASKLSSAVIALVASDAWKAQVSQETDVLVALANLAKVSDDPKAKLNAELMWQSCHWIWVRHSECPTSELERAHNDYLQAIKKHGVDRRKQISATLNHERLRSLIADAECASVVDVHECLMGHELTSLKAVTAWLKPEQTSKVRIAANKSQTRALKGDDPNWKNDTAGIHLKAVAVYAESGNYTVDDMIVVEAALLIAAHKIKKHVNNRLNREAREATKAETKAA